MLRFSLLVGLCTIMTASAQGAIIVEVGDATVAVGGTTFLDVLISGDDNDPLQTFGFDYTIAGGPGRLEFVDPQPDLQLADGTYIFSGDSFAQINSFPVGTVSTTSVPNDTFVGGDFTDSSADVSLTSSSRLLARLQLTAATALPPSSGDTFSVTFDEVSVNTFFFDSDFNPLTINSGLSDFTGTVTVTSAAAVPEPSSILIFSSCFFALLLCIRLSAIRLPHVFGHAERTVDP